MEKSLIGALFKLRVERRMEWGSLLNKCMYMYICVRKSISHVTLLHWTLSDMVKEVSDL